MPERPAPPTTAVAGSDEVAPLGGVGDAFVDLAGVVEPLQFERVLFEAVDPVEGGGAADRDEEVVVVDRPAVVEFDRALVDVDVGDARLDELGRRRLHLVDGDGDLRLDARGGDAAVDLV